MATHTTTSRGTPVRGTAARGASAAPRGSARPALPTLASAVAQAAPRYLPLSGAELSWTFTPRGDAAERVARPVGVRRRFGELRTALADGWEIVQPIFARPLWSAPDDSVTAFNFVLCRGAATRLLTVPDGRTVARFVRDQRLSVDYRR